MEVLSTLGDGTVSVSEIDGTIGAGEVTDGTTGAGEATDGTTGAGEATDGEVITVPTSILLIETTLITIPAAGLATITTIEITLIALAGEVFTTLIPTLGALL
jgi:hypothetical protein